MSKSRGAFKDHFSSRAAGYSKFRPNYPDALFDWLRGLAPGHALAWDAGTGNGQAAQALAGRFEHVLATDASEQQIAHAEPHAGITYTVAPAHESGLEAATCDLVTAAQALHWFDIPAFFAEAGRVLRPRGIVAVWTYGQPALDDPLCDAILQRYVGDVNPYWPPERALVETGYATVAFPFDEIAAPAFELELMSTVDAFAGYVRTWSATEHYGKALGKDPVVSIESALRRMWPAGESRRAHWRLSVRAGRR
ncbi:MAG: class I SAM-dependent methyltransferase [Gemmatimonadales bacterium]